MMDGRGQDRTTHDEKQDGNDSTMLKGPWDADGAFWASRQSWHVCLLCRWFFGDM